jgi:mRNA-degrading endonuclease toxin of MazEF toxin-antitoxin module
VTAPLHQGRIVWVELLDPQGRNPKVRPAVIVTATRDILPDGDVVVAAVTTQLDTAPTEVCVELPWQRGGHPRTKLNSRNVVVCTWLVTIPVNEIRGTAGVAPIGQMNRILDIVRQLNATASPPPPPAAGP